jgi:hypothetical protein
MPNHLYVVAFDFMYDEMSISHFMLNLKYFKDEKYVVMLQINKLLILFCIFY